MLIDVFVNFHLVLSGVTECIPLDRGCYQNSGKNPTLSSE